MNIVRSVMDALASVYDYADAVYVVLGVILSALTFHHTLYFIVSIFFTRKFKRAEKYHKYAVVIAARNEEAVIGNLIDSIHAQDYPKEYVTVFVVADNCTDNTAKIAREKGACCYERFDDAHRTKGFALQFLFDRIEEDYGRDSFEGYFVFDADNLLSRDYISRMNDSFDEGCKVITSYRNTKNFDENWIASTYALHWLRSIRTNHRVRSVFHLATNIQGTGFLFANELVKNGWNYTSLTEDRAFTADCVVNGYEITYNDEAVFYDEQPVSLKIAMRQRIRWAKGHILAFCDSGPGLLANIFRPKLQKLGNGNEKGFKAVLTDLRFRWMSFDTFAQLVPRNIVSAFRWLFMNLLFYPAYCYVNGFEQKGFGWHAFLFCILSAVISRILYRVGRYFASIPISVYLFAIERGRIAKIPLRKMALYCLTWPTFDIIGRYAQYLALFMKVTWKTIPHESKIRIEDIKNECA